MFFIFIYFSTFVFSILNFDFVFSFRAAEVVLPPFRHVATAHHNGVGGVYLSLNSCVTRRVKRPQSIPIRKSIATAAPITVRM